MPYASPTTANVVLPSPLSSFIINGLKEDGDIISDKPYTGGVRLKAFLVFDELTIPFPHRTYTDELSFVISAN